MVQLIENSSSKLRILVSGVGGDTGQGVVKSLQKSDLNIEVFGMCIKAESPFLYKVDHGLVAPKSADPDYIPFLIKTIKKYSIDLFVPTIDSEIPLIALNRDRIEAETESRVLVGNSDHVAIANDKLSTAVFLEEIGVKHPRTVLASDSQGVNNLLLGGYPVVVKPRSGNGSIGVRNVSSPDELLPFLGKESYIVQEWLDPQGGEYTTGIYTSRHTPNKAKCTLLRELKNGSTFIATRVIDDSLDGPLEHIAGILDVPYLNIQSMCVNGELSVFELNPRLSGTTAIVSRVFNPVELFIREVILGQSPNFNVDTEAFIAMRYLEEHYEAVQRVNNTRLSGLTS